MSEFLFHGLIPKSLKIQKDSLQKEKAMKVLKEQSMRSERYIGLRSPKCLQNVHMIQEVEKGPKITQGWKGRHA